MAHSDYNCCAVCDRKMGYQGIGARSKTEICSSCVADLAEQGVIVHHTGELIEWIEETETEEVESVLDKVGFSFCYYSNSVDEALESKGIKGGL